ncbi:hypothetical protein XCR_0644 [Xanthomonas campestris pv. raphani 756C]|nr:hypothetical protein XCR_0644 [Xanthomonas campestris pv. raphani 756C]
MALCVRRGHCGLDALRSRKVATAHCRSTSAALIADHAPTTASPTAQRAHAVQR